MSTIIQGWSVAVAVQKETILAAPSSETVYNLAGKSRFTYEPVVKGFKPCLDVFRTQVKERYNSKYWQGTIELELGLNAVTKLLFDSLFELAATTIPSVGLTKYEYRPPKLYIPCSLKFFFTPAGLTTFSIEGAVITRVRVELRVKALPKMTVNWIAVKLGTSSPGTPIESVTTLPLPATSGVSVNAIPLTFATEINWEFSDERVAVRFGEDRIPTKFGLNGNGIAKGEIAEYFNTDSSLPGLASSQAEVGVVQQFGAVGGRNLQAAFPRVVVTSGYPDAISSGDLPYRAGFTVLESTIYDVDTQPVIYLTI